MAEMSCGDRKGHGDEAGLASWLISSHSVLNAGGRPAMADSSPAQMELRRLWGEGLCILNNGREA